jgi:hypothetical protein
MTVSIYIPNLLIKTRHVEVFPFSENKSPSSIKTNPLIARHPKCHSFVAKIHHLGSILNQLNTRRFLEIHLTASYHPCVNVSSGLTV